MGNLSSRQTVGLIAILAVILGIIGWSALKPVLSAAAPGITLREPPAQTPAAPPVVPPVRTTPSQPAASSASEPAPAEVVVHVAGAVRKPGVYHLRPGARNDDALKAAGGPTDGANTDAVNLAARVEDGSQLYFPTHKEQPDGGASSPAPSLPPAASAGKQGGRTAAQKPGKKGEKGGKPGKLTAPSQGTVNINTADAEQLQRLPGIGPAMAERLIAFRKENGGFKSAEDLLQVSGIGEKKFARLQPFVRVR